jgi:hypothetical protein
MGVMGWDLYPAFVNAGKVMVLGNYVIRIGSYRTIDKFIVAHWAGTFRSRTLFLSKNAPFPTLAIKLRLERSATMRTALGLKQQSVCEEKPKPILYIMAEFCWTPCAKS